MLLLEQQMTLDSLLLTGKLHGTYSLCVICTINAYSYVAIYVASHLGYHSKYCVFY